MNTPIFDFLKKYAKKHPSRFHMPGHKGRGALGCEKYDITEIPGADVLYSPNGIILESENNASRIFNTAHSFYSTEGATLAIRAMLAAVKRYSKSNTVLSTRSAHKSFISSCALLGLNPVFIDKEEREHIAKSDIDTDKLISILKSERPMAIYITSPDYLGNTADIPALSKIAKSFGVPLLVDNAHGAYLNFLENNRHPISLGADMCADSAHKTLPALTGTAYLHVSNSAPAEYLSEARRQLSFFASTSPSYLLLSSLDKINPYLEKKARSDIHKTAKTVEECKRKITNLGFFVESSEPLKITLNCLSYGYFGTEIAKILSSAGVECEYSDGTYAVFMCSPKNKKRDYKRLIKALSGIPKREALSITPPSIKSPERKMSVREAYFSDCEEISVSHSLGRICQSVSVSCPPAIPIVTCGELIDEQTVKTLEFYGVEKISLVK